MRALVEVGVARCQGQLTDVGHGIAGIDRQVEDDHLGLGGVGQCLPQGQVQVQTHRNVATQRAAQQLFQAGQGTVEVQRHRLQTLAAGEGQQLRGQLGTTLTRFADMGEASAGLVQVGLGQVALQKAGTGEYHRQ
ncbi:hypothetical protein D9M71_634130 [compost metagenome]